MATIFAGAAMVTAAPAVAQDAVGYWEGRLLVAPGVTLRIGLDISRDDAGALKGTLDSRDQNSFDIPLTTVTVADGVLSFTVAPLSAGYEGRWNAGHSAWEGTFRQSGQSFGLDFSTATPPERTAATPLPAEWAVPDDAALRDIIATRIAGRPGEGIAIGLVEPGGERFAAFGPAGNAVFDAHTLFEIGSMTKIFTALILSDMALDGEVDLDDPVAKYLPDGATMPSRNGKQITLRMLSMQNSGLPRLPDNMPYGNPQDPYADYTEQMLLDFLGKYQLPRDPGAQYEYSNLGVGLLGYVLSRAAGTDYESLVRERILDQLGMDDTAITLSPDQQARFAPGYDQFMQPTGPWALPVLAGAGALRSTAADMAKFLAAALDPDSPIGPAMELTLSDRLGPTEGDQTALGWMILHPPTGEVLMHGGGTGGYRTHMALQPATGRAVVVLTNSAAEPSAQDIALHALFGAPIAATPPVPSPPPPPSRHEEVKLTIEQLDHVTGTYRIRQGLDAVVRRDGSQLYAQLTGQQALPIYPEGPLGFFLRVVDAQIRFTEEDGEVTGGTLIQNGNEVPLEKVE